MKLLTIAVISMMIMLSSNSSFADEHAESIEQTVKAVSEGYAEVVKRGFAWTTTKPLIDQAKEAIAKGNKVLTFDRILTYNN